MAQFFVNLDKSSKERFDMGKFMPFTDNFDPLTSFFMTELPKLPTQGYYNVKGEEGRPDFMSHSIYKNEQYWWVILIYNKKLEFDSFKNGDIVPFPSLSDVEDLFFSLKAKETAANAKKG